MAFDLVPFIGALALGIFVAVRLSRTQVDRRVILCLTYSAAAYALIAALGVAHLTSVIIEAAHGPFVYDFRLYALVQLGLVFLVAGQWGLFAASRMLDAPSVGMRRMAFVWAVVLAVDVPLIPLQGFAVLFTALAASGLLSLWYTYR